MKKYNQNRRDFLKQSGLISSGFFLDPTFHIIDNQESKKEKITLGVIGTGSRGLGLIKILKNIPQFKLVACCDILPWRLEQSKKFSHPYTKFYDNYRFLLEDKTIDAVIISTPLFSHYQIALDALIAGKHVYCEKTMTFDSSQANQIVQKTKENNELVFQVGYQYRSSKLYQSIVEMVQNGSIGTVTGINCQWNRNGDWRRVAPDAQYEKMVNWRMYKEYSRGLLGELSSHQIDFVNWITGKNPIKVIATGGIDYWKDGRETNDNIRAVFDYPNGIKASFTCQTANAYNGFQILIFGDKATIVMNQNSAYIHPEVQFKEYGIIDGVTSATVSSDIADIPVNISSIEPTLASLINFTNCILKGDNSICTPDDGRNTTIAVQMASDAIEENRSVFWEEYN